MSWIPSFGIAKLFQDACSLVLDCHREKKASSIHSKMQTEQVFERGKLEF